MSKDVKRNPDPFDVDSDQYMTTGVIRSLTAAYPNDADLGQKVRELITNKYGVISKKEGIKISTSL